MIRLNERSMFSGLLFCFAAVLLWDSIGMKPATVLVPRIVGVAMLVLAGIQFLMDLFPKASEKLAFLSRSADSSRTIGGEGAIDGEAESPRDKRLRLLYIGWLALFVALIYFIGMIYALAVSMFVYLRWISGQSWTLSILYPVATALIVYLAFVKGLNIYYFM